MTKAFDIWNELLKKPDADRSAVERIIVDSNAFLIDFEMGGWLYNISPAAGEGRVWNRLRRTADSIDAIGMPSIAHTLREIATITEAGDVQEQGTWDTFLAKVDPTNALERLEKIIDPQVETAWTKLEEFTVRHFDCDTNA